MRRPRMARARLAGVVVRALALAATSWAIGAGAASLARTADLIEALNEQAARLELVLELEAPR